MKIIKIITISLILNSCVSLNTHQSGRSLGKDNTQFFANINYGETNIKSFVKTEYNKVFLIDLGGYHGITKKTDIGLKIGNSFKLNALFKSQIIGNKKSLFASSIASEVGAGIFGILSFNTNVYLVNSFHPTNYLTFTLTPKYAYSWISRQLNNKDLDHLYGYSSGILIGRKNKISIEIAQFSNAKNNFLKTKPFIGVGLLINK